MVEREEYKDVSTANSDKVKATPCDVDEIDRLIKELPDEESALLTSALKLAMELGLESAWKLVGEIVAFFKKQFGL